MADLSPNLTRQNSNTKSDDNNKSNSAITAEQVKAIADRVYSMLLQDLKHERERNRNSVWKSRTFKRG